jgi:hypothetical protein
MFSALVAAFWTDPLAKIIAMFALLIGCATFAVVYTVNVRRPKRRRKELEQPGSAYFLVPSRRNHSCEYAAQHDDDEHLLKELTLPPNSEVTVDFVIDLKVPISYSELNIECQGPVETKPYAIRYFNRFIELGEEQEIAPGPGAKHYIDKHKVYHARGDRAFPPTRIAVAFVIKTRSIGTFPVRFGFVSNEIIGSIGGLFITVEGTPTVSMRVSILRIEKEYAPPMV